MSDFTDFLDDFLNERLSDIDIGMVGRIEVFDSQKMRADVIPLMKKKSNEEILEYSMLKDIPVNFLLSGDYYIRPEYKQGDLVHIAFSTHDIEEALRDKKPLESKRIFSSENAFIVGGVSKTNWTPPEEFSEPGLLIGHKDGRSYTQYLSDKMIHKFDGKEDLKEMEISGTGIKMLGNEIKITDSGVDINNGALTVSK